MVVWGPPVVAARAGQGEGESERKGHVWGVSGETITWHVRVQPVRTMGWGCSLRALLGRRCGLSVLLGGRAAGADGRYEVTGTCGEGWSAGAELRAVFYFSFLFALAVGGLGLLSFACTSPVRGASGLLCCIIMRFWAPVC